MQNIYESESNFVQLQMMTTKRNMDLPFLQLMPIQGPGQIDPLNLDYQVAVSMRDTPTKSGRMSTLGLEITLTRLRSQVFIENIVPSGFLVVVSWVQKQTFAFFLFYCCLIKSILGELCGTKWSHTS